MQKDSFDRILSFLLGASWAIVLFGALITFKLFASIFLTLTFIFISLFLVLLLDSFKTHRERLEEAKKQTKLLEQIKNSFND